MAEFDAFAYITETYGGPEQALRVDPQAVAAYRHRLPAGMLRFWQQHGRGSYRQGRFWVADPAALQPVVEAMFGGDEEFRPSDLATYGYTAFGTLRCWHPAKKCLSVDPVSFDVTNPGDPAAPRIVQATISDDFAIGMDIHLGISDDGLSSVLDEQGEDLFPEALARLGRLAPGEVYGFVPPLGFGGRAHVEGLRRVPLLEHLLFLAQLGPLTLKRLTRPSPGLPFGELVPVRAIGTPGVP